MSNDRNEVADTVVKYKDKILIFVFGGLMLALVGLADVTLVPDAAEGGYTVVDSFHETGALSWSIALVGTIVAAIVAFGSNRLRMLWSNSNEVEWTSPDALALGGAAGIPFLHEAVPQIADATAGEPVVQGIFFTVAFASFVFIARFPPSDD